MDDGTRRLLFEPDGARRIWPRVPEIVEQALAEHAARAGDEIVIVRVDLRNFETATRRPGEGITNARDS